MAALIALLIAVLGASPAWAGKADDLRLAELERVRARAANQVHLVAFDLVDEMVYGWTQEPVFAKETAVVLASVTVPVGLGTPLEALLENHLSDVIGANPNTNVQLVHCPACTQVVVHSAANATVISRGIDSPALWDELGPNTGKYALFVDVEAEGSFLVLRARLTELQPDLPIVWSRTLSSGSSPAMLRSGQPLVSVAQAREEYLDTLAGKGLSIPFRIAIRAYAESDREQPVPAGPFIWLQSGFEVRDRTRRNTGSLLVGATFVPDFYQGIMAEARINTLLTGRARSVVRPDLYLFFGGGLITVWGPAAGPLSNERLTAEQLLAADDPNRNPRSSFGTLSVGLDLRMGSHIGFSTFLEAMPTLRNSPNIGHYIRFGNVLELSAFGTEVTFWL